MVIWSDTGGEIAATLQRECLDSLVEECTLNRAQICKCLRSPESIPLGYEPVLEF
jgi:hypothetical protein